MPRIDYEAKYGTANINDIFKFEDDWEKYAAIKGWVNAGNDLEDDTVLIKTNDGKEFKTTYKVSNKFLTISSNGRRVKRGHAAALLGMYGEVGQWRGVDQMTSFSPVQWARYKAGPDKDVAAALASELTAEGLWAKGEPNFVKQYLYVVQDDQNDTENVAEAV